MDDELAARRERGAPWLPCPECGEVWHRAVVTLERDDATGAWRPASMVATVACSECGHRFAPAVASP
jgi:uncharacterized Zn finger protein